MQKKLTISVDEDVYEGLHRVVGRGSISRFIQDVVRPHVIGRDLAAACQAMAREEKREADALEWSEGLSARPA